MSLAEAVQDALSIPAPQDSQHAVQDLIAKRLDEISPSTTIRRTGYFNHAWVPDLVVRPENADERQVFLRFDVKETSFSDDLEYLSQENPFFLDIALDGSQTPDFDLDSALEGEGRDGVLVSELKAIDRFKTSIERDSEVKTATRQVVVGGHGHVDPSTAETIVNHWHRASEAAVGASSDLLRDALDEVEKYLDRTSSLDLEADLRATWISAGHEANDFPSREDWQLGDRGPYEIAELVASLLRGSAEVPNTRWTEISQAISATELGSQLAKFGEVHSGGSVNDLARGGLDFWTARYAYAPQLESDSLSGVFDWQVGQYALAINLLRRRAFFSDSGRKWSRVPRPDSLPDVRDRLDSLGNSTVLGVGILTPEEQVSHELRSTATSSLAERLEPFISDEPSWKSARLRWLDLKVPGTEATARVDFSRAVVAATASIPLRSFVLLVGEYVAALTQEEMERLRQALGVEP